MTVEEKIDRLSRQLQELGEIVLKKLEPDHKFCLTVDELAERWGLNPESIRILIREKKLKTLRGFRPFRITLDEIRRYERPKDDVDKLTRLRSRSHAK